MKRFLLLSALAIACGRPDGGFAGAWTGTTDFQLQGYAKYSYPSSLVVDITGGDISVSGVCPVQASSIETPASVETAHWSGSLDCGLQAIAGCDSSDMTLRSADFQLHGGTLTAQLYGWATGCTAPLTSFAINFSSDKQ